MDTQTSSILKEICYAISTVAEAVADLVEQNAGNASPETVQKKARELRGVVDKLLQDLP